MVDIGKRISDIRLRTGKNTVPRDFGFPCFPLYCYYPTDVPYVSQDSINIRRMIWNFKYDRNHISAAEHSRAVRFFVPKVVKTLSLILGDGLKDCVLMCIPAKTVQGNELRWKDFSHAVCEESRMEDGYGYVSILSEGTQKHLHIGRGRDVVLSFDRDAIEGKYIVVCDDICSYGKTMKTFYRRLLENGAKDCLGITLGITTHNTQMMEPICMYKNRIDSTLNSRATIL